MKFVYSFMFSVVIFQTNYTSYATLLDLKGMKFLDWNILWYGIYTALIPLENIYTRVYYHNKQWLLHSNKIESNGI